MCRVVAAAGVAAAAWLLAGAGNVAAQRTGYSVSEIEALLARRPR